MTDVWASPYLEESVFNSYQTSHEQRSSYSLEDHPYIYKGTPKELYQKFKTQVLALDENATEEFLKLYVAFKLDTNFVDVVPQASGLRLSLNCKYKDIHDPKGLCKDVTDLGRWGNGDVSLKISQVSELPYAVELIQQVIDMQIEG